MWWWSGASKALVVPYGLLQIGTRAGLQPSASAFLALSYLGPWIAANACALDASPAHEIRQRAGGDDGGKRGGVDVEAVLLGAAPDRVFLSEGEVCSICLDEFDAAAVAAARNLTGGALAEALRGLDPSVVALRCGQPLHADCARCAAAHSAGWPVRCPLCREPVTARGAAAARIFS